MTLTPNATLIFFEQVHIHDSEDELQVTRHIKNILFKSKINVPVKDVISCNGFLFLSTSNIVPSPRNLLSRFLHHRLFNSSDHYSHHEQIFTYNPLTGEIKILLGCLFPRNNYSVYGFGFHPRTKEFKVVRIVN